MMSLEQKSVILSWDEHYKSIILVWKNPVSSEDFRDVMEQGIALLGEKKASRWVADIQSLKTIRPEDQVWLNKVFFPDAIKKGLKTVGMVVSQGFVSQSEMKKLIEKENSTHSVTINLFKDINDALKWVSQ